MYVRDVDVYVLLLLCNNSEKRENKEQKVVTNVKKNIFIRIFVAVKIVSNVAAVSE